MPSCVRHDSNCSKHVGKIAAAKIDHAIAIALSILELVREFAADSGVQLDPDVGIELRETLEIGRARHGGDHMVGEAAQDAARGKAVASLTPREARGAALGDIEQHAEAIGAVDLLVQIGKLRGHARIDLDDRDAIGAGVVHHLDIEDAVIEAEALHRRRGDFAHARLHAIRQVRRIVEAGEGERAGEHDGIHHAEDGRRPAMRIAFDGDLLAFEQPLGDQPLGADGRAGIALEHAFERQEELIEICPMRQERRELGGRSPPVRRRSRRTISPA